MTSKLPWATAAVIIVVAAVIGAWALWPTAEVPAVTGQSGTWTGTISTVPGSGVVFAAPEPTLSGLENVYIVKNTYTGPWNINLSGDANVLGTITGSGATATIPFDTKFKIVVAAKGHADSVPGDIDTGKMRVQLKISAWNISENKQGAALTSFAGTPTTYYRVNAVWDNNGNGYSLAADANVAVDNVALFLQVSA